MTNIINPKLAQFAGELSERFEQLLGEHAEFVESFGPVGLVITTTDGPTAQFFEEGIEFYPKLTITEEKEA